MPSPTRSVRLLQSKQRSSRYRGGQARLGGRSGAETKDAGNIAGASETARKRSVNRSTTLLLGSESGWNGIFGEFGRDLEASAVAAEDRNRLPYLISLTLGSSNARRQLRPDQFCWRELAPGLTPSP